MGPIRRTRAPSPHSPNWLVVYGSLFVIAEATFVLQPALGAALHAGLLVAIAAHSALTTTAKDPQLPVLVLLPTARLLSLVMPSSGLDPIQWHLRTALPLLIGIVLVGRSIGVTWAGLGLGRPRVARETLFAVGAGLTQGMLLAALAPALRIRGEAPAYVMIPVMAVTIVIVEELLFRGLLQRMAAIRSPRLAIVIPNVLYAAMYLQSGNGVVALAMGMVGLLFSGYVVRTGSLWGVLGAHLLMRVVIQFAATP